MKQLLVDPKCPKPYDSEVQATRGLGGMEASVVRVSRALSQMPYAQQVTALRYARSELRQESATLRFAPISELVTAAAGAAYLVKVQVREAQRVVYPHVKRCKTVGIVYAKANAVGAPMLAHKFGAAREALCADKPPQVARNAAAAPRTLNRWIAVQAPVVKGDGRFDIPQVTSDGSPDFTDPKQARQKLKRETT